MSTTAGKTTQPKRIEQSNIYRLSNRTPFKKAIFLSKIILKKHASIQLQSVGVATSEATKLAQALTKYGYGKIKSIRTQQFLSNNENSRFQIKLVVVLEKSAEFDKLTESLIIRQ